MIFDSKSSSDYKARLSAIRNPIYAKLFAEISDLEYPRYVDK